MSLKSQESGAKKIWLVENNRFFLLAAADTKEEVRQHCARRIRGPVSVYEEVKPEVYFGGHIYVNQGGLFTLRYNRSTRRKELYLEWVEGNTLYKINMTSLSGTVVPETDTVTPANLAVHSFFPGTTGIQMNEKGEVITRGTVRSYFDLATHTIDEIRAIYGLGPVRILQGPGIGPDLALHSDQTVVCAGYDLAQSFIPQSLYRNFTFDVDFSLQAKSAVFGPSFLAVDRTITIHAGQDIYKGQIVSVKPDYNNMDVMATVDFSEKLAELYEEDENNN